MSEPTQMDRTFSFIMKRMMKTGQALFYTEIAKALGVRSFVWNTGWF